MTFLAISIYVLNDNQVLVSGEGELWISLHVNNRCLQQRLRHYYPSHRFLTSLLLCTAKQLIVHLSYFPTFLVLHAQLIVSHLSSSCSLICQLVCFFHQLLVVKLHLSKTIVDSVRIKVSFLHIGICSIWSLIAQQVICIEHFRLMVY